MRQKILIGCFALTFFILVICIFWLNIHYFNLDACSYATFKHEIDTHNVANNTIYNDVKEQLLPSDYLRLINLNNFQFDILNTCDFDPLLLVLIHTSPANFGRRKSIRQTWGSVRTDLKLIFLLGKVRDVTLQKKLEDENKVHGDLVQGTFMDDYRNMTYKYVMAFKYTLYHCAGAKYILKSDDDVFVNMPAMMSFLKARLTPCGVKKFVLCSIMAGSPAIREPDSKWYVPVTEFKDDVYPPYCSGYAVLYSPDVVFTLYKKAQNSTFFWVDDAFVTGILVKDTNILFTNVDSLMLSNEDVDDMIKDGESSTNGSRIFLYGPLNMSPERVYTLWSLISN